MQRIPESSAVVVAIETDHSAAEQGQGAHNDRLHEDFVLVDQESSDFENYLKQNACHQSSMSQYHAPVSDNTYRRVVENEGSCPLGMNDIHQGCAVDSTDLVAKVQLVTESTGTDKDTGKQSGYHHHDKNREALWLVEYLCSENFDSMPIAKLSGEDYQNYGHSDSEIETCSETYSDADCRHFDSVCL